MPVSLRGAGGSACPYFLGSPKLVFWEPNKGFLTGPKPCFVRLDCVFAVQTRVFDIPKQCFVSLGQVLAILHRDLTDQKQVFASPKRCFDSPKLCLDSPKPRFSSPKQIFD